MRYETVKAKTREEALAASAWKVGDLGRCIKVSAIGNSDGTFSILPTFETLGPLDVLAEYRRREKEG
jgi:hypothetical protein